MRRAVFLDRDGVLNRAVHRAGRPFVPASLDELDRRGPAETLAGYMSAAAIFLAVMALAYRPLVLALCALVALVRISVFRGTGR